MSSAEVSKYTSTSLVGRGVGGTETKSEVRQADNQAQEPQDGLDLSVALSESAGAAACQDATVRLR